MSQLGTIFNSTVPNLPISDDLAAERTGIRKFASGAIRDTEEGKLDYEGFLSPMVLKRYAEYMHKNRQCKDGTLRDGDDWQKGIPKDVYMESMLRHVFAVWDVHRGTAGATLKTAFQDQLCAVMFNVMGYLFEELRDGREDLKNS